MRIAVCVKQVPASLAKNLLTEGKIKRDVQLSEMNPADVFSLETAFTIKEQYGGQVDIFSMGPEAAKQTLKEAAAMGADRLFLLSDQAFAGSDTYATALVLSAALRKQGAYDLIFCGRRTADGETGQVPIQIAEMLGIPAVTNVVGIEAGAGEIVCRRQMEGDIEVRRCKVPVLIGIMEGIEGVAHPRLPSLMGLRHAAQKEIISMDRESLGLRKDEVGSKGSFTEVKQVFLPNWNRNCKFFGMEDGVQKTIEAVLDARNGREAQERCE